MLSLFRRKVSLRGHVWRGLGEPELIEAESNMDGIRMSSKEEEEHMLSMSIEQPRWSRSFRRGWRRIVTAKTDS